MSCSRGRADMSATINNFTYLLTGRVPRWWTEQWTLDFSAGNCDIRRLHPRNKSPGPTAAEPMVL